MERKGFQDLLGEDNPQFIEDGKEIFLLMMKKYPQKTVVNLDNILNGISAAFVILANQSVDRDNYPMFTQLVYRIITKNLK